MTDKTKPTKFEQTHIAMVLDRSGSMDTCRAATIASVNKYLAEARDDANLKEADFELSIFDSQSIDVLRTGAPIRLSDITTEDYVPRGGTPLYDAIGRGIDGLDTKLTASGSGKAILVIVTDGEENASRKYNHAAITELIKGRQAAGWLVVFLGAGLDSAKQGLALGVAAAYTANFATDSASLSNVGSVVRGMSSSYASNATSAEAKQWMASGRGALSMSARKSMGDKSGGDGLINKLKTPPPAVHKAPPPKVKTDAYEDSSDAWGS